MLKTIELPFTTLELHEKYVIARTREGVHVTMVQHQQVLEAINENFSAPFAFIIDEVNSYSVDLGVMLSMSEDENICCIGVRYHRLSTKLALGTGEDVIEKPIYFSDDLTDVINWVTNHV